MKCTCIICFRELRDFNETTGKDRGFHPIGGLEFITYGHYGSTVFDPVNGDSLHVVICDTCVSKELKFGRIKKEIKQ